MKRPLAFIAIISIIVSSCIKDRIQPVTPPAPAPTGDTLMYYWNFNIEDSSYHTADFGINSGAHFNYYCAYIDYTAGSILNAQAAGDSGTCLRVRNPSDSIIFYMPTTGYDSISIQFAEQSSGSGPSQNAIFYTIDGIHFISTGISNNSYSVATTWALYNFSVADTGARNNPKFAIKIVPLNNNTGSSGNDRIDNVTVRGKRQ